MKTEAESAQKENINKKEKEKLITDILELNTTSTRIKSLWEDLAAEWRGQNKLEQP